MANKDAYSGFQPIGHYAGGVIRTEPFKLASGYNTAIYTGDIVTFVAGRVNVATAASIGTAIIGVFAGCEWDDSSGVPGRRWSPYWPASQVTTGSVAATAHVWADPYIIYRVQTDTDVAYVDVTHALTRCDMIATHAGSAVHGQSGQEILCGTVGDGQVLILGLVDEPGNAAGVNAKVRALLTLNVAKLSAAP